MANRMLDLVKKALQEFDEVYLVTHLSSQMEWGRFCDVFPTFIRENIDGKFLFMIEEGVNYSEGMHSMALSHDDAMELYKLYLTYEFSDRFTIFANNMQYGTIFCYADTGILTEAEVVRAILCR